MTNKEIENMKPGENPYLEDPETFDPAIKNEDKLVKGGGGNVGEK